MTSYEFEVAAKNAVSKVMKERFGIQVSVKDLEFVWFAHELGNKKCTLFSPKLALLYPEVTYNKYNNEMYVDIYTKVGKSVIEAKDFDYTVKE